MKHWSAVPFAISSALLAAAPTPAAAEKPIIAVFNVEDRGVGLSNKLLLRLSDYLAMQLAATGAYQLVPRDQLKQRLTQQKKTSYKACYAQTCQIEIGKELAAQKSLATSIMKLGSKCMVTSVMYDLRKSASEGGASVEGTCSEDGIVASIRGLVTKLVPKSKVKSPTANQPKNRGGILIKTQPKGARIKLDGVPVSGATPLAVTDLAAGEHLLEIAKDDFRHTGKVKVRADDFVTVSIRLKKARVQLEVVSDPPEATILLNGMEVGRTPRLIPSVKAGDHVIELRKDGYFPKTQELRLGAGTPRQSIRVALKKAAILVVESRPAKASILVDGEQAGTTPARVPVDGGSHVVRIEAQGHHPFEKSVSVTEGQQIPVRATLEPTDAEKARRAALGADRRALDARHVADTLQIRERRSKAIWGYTTLGVGAALVTTAVILYGVGASQGGDAHDAYMSEADTAPPSDVAALDQYRSDIENARGKMTAGHVLMGLGAAATGIAVYLLVTRPDAPEPSSPTELRSRVTVAPTASGGALFVAREF